MRIEQHARNVLILRPQSMVFALLGIALLTLSAFLVINAFSTEKLICAHTVQTSFTCITQRATFGVTWHETRFENIQHTQAKRTSNPFLSHHITLSTPDGELPLPIFKSSNENKTEQLVQEINTVIQTPQTDLFERSAGETDFVFLALCPLSMAALFLALGAQKQTTTWTFDRQAGRLIHYHNTPLLGARTRIYALQDIANVQLVRGQRGLATITIFLRDGQMLFLDGDNVNLESHQSITRTIRQFLELPPPTHRY
jgi:hypothetical protein